MVKGSSSETYGRGEILTDIYRAGLVIHGRKSEHPCSSLLWWVNEMSLVVVSFASEIDGVG